MPVIKADAYGHGLLDIASALWEDRFDHLAVGTVFEAVQLRKGGFGGVIVALLGALSDEDIAAAREHCIVPLIHDWSGLERLGTPAQRPLIVGLKVNTGMSRLGFPVGADAGEFGAVLDFLGKQTSLNPEYLISHLAVADVPGEDAFTLKQVALFQRAVAMSKERYPSLTASLGNSAGLLAYPQLAGDLARPGIALYGGNPFYNTEKEFLGAELLQVMQVTAPVLETRKLYPGQSIGYGRTYVAESERTVAIVGVGYADGFRRNPHPEACLTLHGRRARIVGRVSMQMTAVDITDLLSVKPGDSAYILGGEGDAVTVHDLADWWGSLPYEVMCLLGALNK